MMARLALLFTFLLFAYSSFSQGGYANNPWSTMGLMRFEREGAKGKFLPMVKQMEGKSITLKGYIVPLSGQKAQSHFMFSYYPANACFFCGKAGPESAIEVFMKDNKAIPYTDQPITLKGNFRMISEDPNDMMFRLEQTTQL